MTISLYNIAKAILRTKITYITVQLRYFGNNLTRKSNIVIVNNNNNIVIFKLSNTRIRKRYTAISRKVVGKSPRDNPERHCGWL